MLQQNTGILSRWQAFGGNPEELTCQCRKKVWRALVCLARCHLHRVPKDNLFVKSKIFLCRASGWCQWLLSDPLHSSAQPAPVESRIFKTHSNPSTFGGVFTTDSASPKNTAKSTSFHPAFLAWLFISSATLIQTSWLGLIVSHKHAFVKRKITNKKFQPVT